MLSANALRGRQSDFEMEEEWVLDSGAFSQLSREGGFVDSPAEYAIEIERWSRCGDMVAAVSQDYMCEPKLLRRFGASVLEHQRLTTERYRSIREHVERIGTDVHLMPVLQGWKPSHYRRHIEMYGPDLEEGMWVGVGSICKRNGSPADIEAVLREIGKVRPDLRLHGFGVKTTAFQRRAVRGAFYSADSMSWSYHERENGGDSNGPEAAREFYDRLTTKSTDAPLFSAMGEV